MGGPIEGLRCFDWGSEVKVIKPGGTIEYKPARYWETPTDKNIKERSSRGGKGKKKK